MHNAFKNATIGPDIVYKVAVIEPKGSFYANKFSLGRTEPLLQSALFRAEASRRLVMQEKWQETVRQIETKLGSAFGLYEALGYKFN